jgi:hypothetical protein
MFDSVLCFRVPFTVSQTANRGMEDDRKGAGQSSYGGKGICDSLVERLRELLRNSLK